MLADKKKLFVIAVAGVAVIGIGAFMFSRPQQTPPAKPTVAKNAHKGAPTEQLSSTPTTDAAKNPVTGPAGGPANVTADASNPQSGQVRDPFDGTRWEPLPPNHNTQPIPPAATKPFDPTRGTHPLAPGQVKALGKLPPAGEISITPEQLGNPDQINKVLGTDPRGFNYTLIGVITGIHPVVVFATPDFKNQRLVQLNGSLGPDTKVLRVSRGQALVYNHGQELKMTVGADNPTEKR